MSREDDFRAACRMDFASGPVDVGRWAIVRGHNTLKVREAVWSLVQIIST